MMQISPKFNCCFSFQRKLSIIGIFDSLNDKSFHFLESPQSLLPVASFARILHWLRWNRFRPWHPLLWLLPMLVPIPPLHLTAPSAPCGITDTMCSWPLPRWLCGQWDIARNPPASRLHTTVNWINFSMSSPAVIAAKMVTLSLTLQLIWDPDIALDSMVFWFPAQTTMAHLLTPAFPAQETMMAHLHDCRSMMVPPALLISRGLKMILECPASWWCWHNIGVASPFIESSNSQHDNGNCIPFPLLSSSPVPSCHAQHRDLTHRQLNMPQPRQCLPWCQDTLFHWAKELPHGVPFCSNCCCLCLSVSYHIRSVTVVFHQTAAHNNRWMQPLIHPPWCDCLCLRACWSHPSLLSRACGKTS